MHYSPICFGFDLSGTAGEGTPRPDTSFERCAELLGAQKTSPCSTNGHIMEEELVMKDGDKATSVGLANQNILSHHPRNASHTDVTSCSMSKHQLISKYQPCNAAVELTTADFSQKCQDASDWRIATATCSVCDLQLSRDTEMLRTLSRNRPAFAGARQHWRSRSCNSNSNPEQRSLSVRCKANRTWQTQTPLHSRNSHRC